MYVLIAKGVFLLVALAALVVSGRILKDLKRAVSRLKYQNGTTSDEKETYPAESKRVHANRVNLRNDYNGCDELGCDKKS